MFSVPGLDEGVAQLPLHPPLPHNLNQITPLFLYHQQKLK